MKPLQTHRTFYPTALQDCANMATDQDDDMYLFQGDNSSFAGQTFDNFLDVAAAQNDDDDVMNTDFLAPDDLTIKKEYTASPRVNPTFTRASTSSASSSSSSDSPNHHRNISTTSTASPAMSKNELWDTGINGMSMPMNEQYYGENGGLDQELDQQMASAFDFETAASTPSGFDSATLNSGRTYIANPQMRRSANMIGMSNGRTASPRMTTAPASFFLGSREASPLNALGTMLPTSQAPSPWTKHSPSSGLEETFHHMGMNGDSPGNATFSPNMHMNYTDPQFSFLPESSGTPSSFAKDISSPPSTIHSLDGQAPPTLHIQPTSLKSRVETQIPIKMTLYPLPQGIKRLRLPTHTVSKPKFLAKADVDKTPDTLELSVSLVCTSAMQDPQRKHRALARARGEDLNAYSRPSPASSTGSTSSKEDDEKPLNGGEVRICTGCIQRERKRASRKKQKKPEEEEMFQKDEEKRVVVFNTNEVKEWIDMTKETPTDQSPIPPPGTAQVELPMRIACYCRHQNEKMGFQVIFTIKDYRDKVVAQAMTNSIMITDDHKTHNAPQPLPTTTGSQMPSAPHLPGAGVFQTGGMEMMSNEPPQAKLFKQSYSTPDLTRLQQGFHPQFSTPNNAPFAIPQAMSGNTSATLTPRNLSRPASPSGPSGPATKRRKPSGSGKLPSGLTMTRLDTTPGGPSGAATMPNTAASSPYAPGMPSFMAGAPQQFQQNPHPRTYATSPPTPGGDGTFSNINRSFSLENLPRQALMSAPSSRHPSRPGSPLAVPQNAFGQNDPTFSQQVTNSLMSQSSRRPNPVIHKLVPAEGSTSGGTEVTLLGNGFYQGLEVMFGDTEATTTTFWGEKCLNCIAPPAVQAGMVSVVFKHEHPHYSSVQPSQHVRHSVFTYIDDREVEMLRLALRTIGKQMGTDDPYTAAQQLLQQQQNQSQAGGMYPPQQGGFGMSNGHQRMAPGMGGQKFSSQEMEACLLKMLFLAQRQIGSSPVQLNIRRPTGLTLLHLAASLNMTRFTTALLSAGADPNMLDNNGFTAMHHAAMLGNDEVINQLRLGGADHRLRSIRNFIPADLATTLQAYQATMRPFTHSHSRSRADVSRNTSSRSLTSFWEDSSLAYTESESDMTEEERARSPAKTRRLPFAQPMSRSTQPSRRGSMEIPQALAKPVKQITEEPTSPSTLMNAWRQIVNMTQTQQAQLVDQIQHLQENLPQLPDYQNNGMVRRMSALFPQRPSSATSLAKTDRTLSPTASAPPSYDELYPAGSSSTDTKVDEKSALRAAAAEAALDAHYTQEESTSSTLQKRNSIPTIARSDSHKDVQRKDLLQDRRLFMFWVSLQANIRRSLLLTLSQIPLLLVLISLMFTGTTPIVKMANTVLERVDAIQRVRVPAV